MVKSTANCPPWEKLSVILLRRPPCMFLLKTHKWRDLCSNFFFRKNHTSRHVLVWWKWFLSQKRLFFLSKLDAKWAENHDSVMKTHYNPKLHKKLYPRLVCDTFAPAPLPRPEKRFFFGMIELETSFFNFSARSYSNIALRMTKKHEKQLFFSIKPDNYLRTGPYDQVHS